MKICLVTETFAPEINGVSMTLGRLVTCLSNCGVRITVVAPIRKERHKQEDLQFELFEVPGLPIPRYPELRFGRPCKGTLSRLWKNAKPDIVHIATEGPLGLSALRAARRLSIPVVSSFHTNFHNYTRHYGTSALSSLVLRWLKYFHNRCRRTFVPSQDTLLQLQGVGFLNLRMLSRGVDSVLFGPHRRSQSLRNEWGVDAATPVAIHVGRIAAEKNLDLVVRAFEHMKSALPELKLVLVGDGPARASIQSRFPRIIFAGMRKGEDLASHYASADCFIFASVTETFGNVVTEAMTSCLPVLAYDYAAAARFIRDGISGFTAAFNDEQAFLNKAAQLAAARDGWRQIGEAAREVMAPYSWESIAENYLQDVQILLQEISPEIYNDPQIQETHPPVQNNHPV